jgi:dihydrofolate reductase
LNHITLDGVMQAPGRADEDIRGGFEHGGWSQPYMDQVIGEAFGARMGVSGGLLLGRRTYDDVLAHWNSVPDSPFAEALNASPKWVLSTTMSGTPLWPNTTVIAEDAINKIRELKDRQGGELHVMGSSTVIDLLLRNDFVDEMLLVIHPVVLGSGRKMFPDDVDPVDFELVEASTATTGAIVATLRRSR